MKMEIIEQIKPDDKFWREWSGGSEGRVRMSLSCLILECDKKLLSGRFYPRRIIEDACAAYQDTIKSGRSWGTSNGLAKLKHASHMIQALELRSPSNDPTASARMLIAEMTILKTPAGDILKELIKTGGRPAIRVIGQGETSTEDGIEKVRPGYRFKSFNFETEDGDSTILQISEAVGNKAKTQAAVKRYKKRQKPMDRTDPIVTAMKALRDIDPDASVKDPDDERVSADDIKKVKSEAVRASR